MSEPSSERTLEVLRSTGARRSSADWTVARAPVRSGLARRLLEVPAPYAVGWNPGDPGFEPGSGATSPSSLDARTLDARTLDARVAESRTSEPERGHAFIGLDAAVTLRASGPERFARLREELEGFARKYPELLDVHPLRFFGGASFEPAVDQAWSEFGEALFVLPRVLYVDRGGEAELLVLAPPAELDAALSLAARALSHATTDAPTASPRLPTLRGETTTLDGPGFEALVERIRAGIARGEFEKVVAARRRSLELSAAPRLPEFLARLREIEPSSARFALRVGSSQFVGATPERLVRKRGLRVDTEAVAGSIAARAPGAAERLLGSAKDRAEHQVVVDAILSALAPLLARGDEVGPPRLRALRRILHLHTPLGGELAAPRHALELVERLHPTPAVGGYPRQAALDFLRENEPGARGWYAGPFGWVDAAGDGEFVVALRSALLHGTTAHVYAGAGVVRDSSGAEEFAETELKMGLILAALGLGG